MTNTLGRVRPEEDIRALAPVDIALSIFEG